MPKTKTGKTCAHIRGDEWELKKRTSDRSGGTLTGIRGCWGKGAGCKVAEKKDPPYLQPVNNLEGHKKATYLGHECNK